MGIKERKERQRAELRTAIVQAAVALAQAEGWDGLTMRRVAEAVEYSAPVIYEHFENKDALLHEIRQEGFAQLLNDISTALTNETGIEQRLQAIALGYYHFAQRQPAHYQAMFNLEGVKCSNPNHTARHQRPRLFDLLLQEIGAALPPNAPEAQLHTAVMYWMSMLHGMISLRLLHHLPYDAAQDAALLQQFVRQFLAGVAAA